MQSKSLQSTSKTISVVGKLSDYAEFIKIRLTLLVVFSSIIGFLVVAKGELSFSHADINWVKAFWLSIGGFLITGSAIGFNQIIERRFDKVMPRTAMRPLPQERMQLSEALILASFLGLSGLFILWISLNPLSAILSALSWVLYVLAYTPLKRKTPFAVMVGAFPGAFPPLLGAIAATENFGYISNQGVILFIIQFMWQFPHFWAIAWVADDDYKKAGFVLLPSGHKDKASAFQVLIYTLFLFLIGMAPVFFQMTQSVVASIILFLSGAVLAYQAIQLYRQCTVKAAKQLMFGSFMYLPIVQLAILFG